MIAGKREDYQRVPRQDVKLGHPEHLIALHDSFIATGRENLQFFQTQVETVKSANAEVKSGEELAEFLALVNLVSGQLDSERRGELKAQSDAACLALKEQMEAELEREVSICVDIASYASAAAETNREALIALYNATGGPNWTNNAGWLSDTPVGEWHGVVADSAGGVIALDLNSNGLRGEIPPELGNLSNLTDLSLWQNALSGEVPLELANLSKLEDLRLADNDLIHCLPEALRNVDASVDLPFC